MQKTAGSSPPKAQQEQGVLTYGELFAGVGGFGLGFDRAGLECRWQVEIDPWCQSVLSRHWPDVPKHLDVREVGAKNLCPVDVISFGSPCQDMSVAGKRAGLDGERSGLFHEAIRIIRELDPAYVVWENVPGALSSNGGRDFGAVLDALADSGAVDICWRVLDARFFGVPQRRRRVFVVASFRTRASAFKVLVESPSCGGHPAPRRETGQTVAFTLAGGSPDTSRRIGNGWNTTYLAASLSAGGHPGSNMPGRHKEGDVNLVIQPEARALTARASGYRMDGETENFVVANSLRANAGVGRGAGGERGDGADNLIAAPLTASYAKQADSSDTSSGPPNLLNIAAGVRRLTPLECERLMGWPDDWTRWAADGHEIPDSHRYRMCGNGVVATVAEWLGHRLVQANAFVEAAA